MNMVTTKPSLIISKQLWKANISQEFVRATTGTVATVTTSSKITGFSEESLATSSNPTQSKTSVPKYLHTTESSYASRKESKVSVMIIAKCITAQKAKQTNSSASSLPTIISLSPHVSNPVFLSITF